jgi:HEPN domain-containing protein
MTELRNKDRRAAGAWLSEAQGELRTARLIVREQPDYVRPACFHAHLAAEKALKSVLVASSAPFHKVHELFALLERARETVLGADIDEAIDTLDLQALSGWEIEGRYPADLPEPSKEEMQTLLDASERVVTGVAGLLAPVLEGLDG